MSAAPKRFDNTDGRLRGRRGVERRLRVWRKNPHCGRCGQLTEYPKGFECDHIIPLAHGGRDDEANLQVLCAGSVGCHSEKSASEMHSDPAVQFFPDWIQPSIAELTLVFGPPGSGKSTWVQEQAGKHDMVVDLDLIMAQLSGLPLYHAGEQWLRRSVVFRNRMLAHLASGEVKRAFFIVSGMNVSERDFWIAKLQPMHIHTMPTPRNICVQRIMADARRTPEMKQRNCHGVTQWFAAQEGARIRTGLKTQINEDGWPV